MSEQHDDPLRSNAPVALYQNQDGVVSPTSAESQTSPSMPFMTQANAANVRYSQSNNPNGTAASRHTGPRSSYYVGPPASSSAFGSAPVGVIGRDKPREIIRIERDYSGGELCQFHPTFPLEIEGRISPTVFSEIINDINVIIIDANDSAWACLDNTVTVLSLYISPFLFGSKYKREMKRLDGRIEEANKTSLNPVGLHLRKPIETAFLFMELEYF